MMELLFLVVICSLFCFGFNYATLYTPNFDVMTNDSKRKELYPVDDKKEVLWFIRYYGNKWFPLYLTKPLYGCLMCMGSVYGTLFYFGYALNAGSVINSLMLIKCVVVITAVTGLNRILKGIAQLP